MKELWLVGQYKSGKIGKIVWEFQGIFSTEKKAVAACRNFRYFVEKVTLDQECPDESVLFPDGYYPIPITKNDIL
jgi:hypothetical protein